MNYPLISIMIPTYGQDRYIGQAVASALSQDWPNLEVVITDDASPDATLTRCAPYLMDQRVRYIRRETNLGRVENYRQTLRDARGAWVLNLDGDDYLTNPRFISEAMEVALSDSDIVLVFGAADIAYFDEAPIGRMNERMPPLDQRIMAGEDFLLRHPPFGAISPPHMAAIYHRDTALRCEFYRHDIISSDSESIYRIAVGRKMGLVDSVAGVWRQHDKNASSCASRFHSGEEHGDWLRADSIHEWTRDHGDMTVAELRDLRMKLTAGCAVAGINELRCMGKLYRFPRVIGRVVRTDPKAMPLFAIWMVQKTARFIWRRRKRIPRAIYYRTVNRLSKIGALRRIWQSRVPAGIRRRLAA